MKTIQCKDMGLEDMEDCQWKGEADTIEELVQQVKEHHKEAHPDYWESTLNKMDDDEIKDMIEPHVKEE